MIMMPVTGKLIGVVQPRYLITTGAAIAALSMWHLTGLTGDISYGYAALSRICLAVGLPSQFHQTRLIEHIAPSDIGYQQTVDAVTRFFQAQGSNASDAASQVVAWVGQTLQHQVDLLAHIDVFRSLAIVAAVMMPIALTLKSVDSSATARGH
jgi:MFS transporter, DHA2 family, multidrug resistance protein